MESAGEFTPAAVPSPAAACRQPIWLGPVGFTCWLCWPSVSDTPWHGHDTGVLSLCVSLQHVRGYAKAAGKGKAGAPPAVAAADAGAGAGAADSLAPPEFRMRHVPRVNKGDPVSQLTDAQVSTGRGSQLLTSQQLGPAALASCNTPDCRAEGRGQEPALLDRCSIHSCSSLC